MEFYRQNKKTLDKLAVYALFVVAVYVFIKVVFSYVAPFAMALLISFLFEPLIAFLIRRFKIPRGVLALAAILLIVFLIGTVGTVIAVRIINEARAFALTLPTQTEKIMLSFDSLKTNYAIVLDYIPEELRETADNIGSSFLISLTSTASGYFKNLSASVVKAVPSTFVAAILCLISTFFFIKDRDMIADILARKSPAALVSGYNTVKRGLFTALAGYIRAQSVLMSITAIIAISGLLLLGYPYALFLGLLIAFFDFLPIFGAGFVLWPWALISVVSGDYRMAIGLMIVYAVITLARQLFEPKILGSQIGVHPIITIMSMFIGLKVFGAIGLFAGPFIVITIKTLDSAQTRLP